MDISLKQKEALDFLIKQLESIQQYTKWDIIGRIRSKVNSFQYVAANPSQYDDSLDIDIKNDIVFTVLKSLRMEGMPLPLLRSLRIAIIEGAQLYNYPAMCLLMTIMENSIKKCNQLLGTPEIGYDNNTLLIEYKSNPNNKGFGYDEKEIQSSIMLEIEDNCCNTLNFFVPSAILKAIFPNMKWIERLPGIGYYEEPSQKQVERVMDEFVNYDSISELFPLVGNYALEPEYKSVSGGMLRIHITEIDYHIQRG